MKEGKEEYHAHTQDGDPVIVRIMQGHLTNPIIPQHRVEGVVSDE